VLADGAADPDFVAREVVAQAEHDPRACAVVVVFGAQAEAQAQRITGSLATLVAAAPRREVI
jgi:histidinol dehydrogenase